MLFSAFSFITSSQIISNAAPSVILEGYSEDKSVKWTVTDDGTMTIVPTNGKEGTLTQPYQPGTMDLVHPTIRNWPFLSSQPLADDNIIKKGSKIKKIIANQGTIHILYGGYLFCSGTSIDGEIEYADISSFDTTKCVRFNMMFAWQRNLKTLKTGPKFKGTNATTCSAMFLGDDSLTTFNFLSTFSTPKVTDFSSMFCGKFEEIDLTNIDTIAYINSLDNSAIVEKDMNNFLPGFSNIKKITFGVNNKWRYDKSSSNLNYNGYGIPYCCNNALNYRISIASNQSKTHVKNKWSKTDNSYKNLTFDEILEKCSIDPSFKLAGTWIRDDALPKYNVTFKDGYMKNTISTKSVSEGSNIAKSDFPSVKSYASDGIKFEGWFDESNRECTGGYTNVTKNMTLTARYRPYRITAKFICDDSSEAHIDMNTAYRTKITMPKYTGKVPTGKIFAMWSIKQLDGNTKLLHADETIDVPVVAKCPTDDNGTITFKAVFTAVKNPDTNQNTNQADAPAPTPDTNENIPIAPSPEPKNEQKPAPVTDPKPAAQPVADIVQTGVEILPAVLIASAASIAAILIRRRTK